jgi:cephalosporin hydroxylase
MVQEDWIVKTELRDVSSLRLPRERLLASLAEPFLRLEFAANGWWTRRVVERGPQGRPLQLLMDRISARLFERSAEREAQRASLRAATTIDELIERAGKALFANQKHAEIAQLLHALRALEPSCILEIGVAGGGTNLLLSCAARSVRCVLAIDLYVRNKEKLAYYSPAGQERLFLDASSYAPATVAQVKAGLAGRPLDALFIDGDHGYDGARRDFEAYAPLVRAGGIIALHDIVPDEVTRTGTFTGNWVGEVPALWQDIKASYPTAREFIADPRQDGYGIGMIEFDPTIVPQFRRR